MRALCKLMARTLVLAASVHATVVRTGVPLRAGYTLVMWALYGCIGAVLAAVVAALHRCGLPLCAPFVRR